MISSCGLAVWLGRARWETGLDDMREWVVWRQPVARVHIREAHASFAHRALWTAPIKRYVSLPDAKREAVCDLGFCPGIAE
jgi:hypothetical protein